MEGQLAVTLLDLNVTTSKMTIRSDGVLIMENAILNGGGYQGLSAPIFRVDL